MKRIRNGVFLLFVASFLAAPHLRASASQSCDPQFYSDGYSIQCDTWPDPCECAPFWDIYEACDGWCHGLQPPQQASGAGCSANFSVCDTWCQCMPIN